MIQQRLIRFFEIPTYKTNCHLLANTIFNEPAHWYDELDHFFWYGEIQLPVARVTRRVDLVSPRIGKMSREAYVETCCGTMSVFNLGTRAREIRMKIHAHVESVHRCNALLIESKRSYLITWRDIHRRDVEYNRVRGRQIERSKSIARQLSK